jgi:hypothetical protein
MNEQRTPDELTAENELICTKLLGWTRCEGGPIDPCNGWAFPSEPFHVEATPSFTTWADAGLILEALDDAGLAWVLANGPEGDFECRVFNACDYHCYAETAPLAVRNAALVYIRSLP